MISVTKNSKLALLFSLLVWALAGCGGAEERKAKYLERGIEYFEQDNYEKADIEFRNVLQIDPNTAEPYYYLGVINESKQEWRNAFSYYEKAVELDPGSIRARLKLGTFYVLSANYDKAAEQADQVLAREAENLDALAIKAAILVKQEKPDEGVALLKEILEQDPGHKHAVNLMVSLYENNEQITEALELLERAVSVKPDDALMAKQAQLYLKRKETGMAEEILKDLVQRNPDELNYFSALAVFYVRQDEPAKAEQVLKDAIAADPDDQQRYLLLVDLYTSSFGAERAEKEIKGLIDQQPEMGALTLALARLYEKEEDYNKAEAVYQDMIKRLGDEPDGISAKTRLASLALNQGRKEEARALIEEVLAKNSEDNNALYMDGRISLMDKDYPAAISSFRAVLKGQPDSVEALTLLASAHQANGEPQLARENLVRAVEADPENKAARLRLGTYLAEAREFDDALRHVDMVLEKEPDNVNALRVKADVLAKQGDHEDLEQVLTRLEKASPDTGLGAFGKGRLYKEQKRYPEAVQAFETALAREPDSVLALTELVNAQVEMGDTEGAIDRLSGIVAENPQHPIAHDLMGIAYMKQEAFADAEAAFRKQLEINPESSVVYVQLATALYQQGKGTEAEAVIMDGLKVLPGDERLQSGLAVLYVQSGDEEKAAGVFEQALLDDPGNVNYTLGLAGIRDRQGRHDDVITIYRKLLVANPDNLVAMNNLASTLAEYRSDGESLAEARKLSEKLAEATQPAIRDTVGWVHYKSGDYVKAAEVLSAVVEEQPEIAVFRYHLGMTYYKQGDMRAARELLSGAVAEEYTYPGVEEARKVFQEIGME